MLTRIITAVVALCVLIPVLLFAPGWAVVCVWGLLGAVAVYEFFFCVGFKKEIWLLIVATVCAVLYISSHCVKWALLSVEQADLYRLWTCIPSFALWGCILAFMFAAVARFKALPVDRLVMLLGLCMYAFFGFHALGSLSSMGDIHYFDSYSWSYYDSSFHLWIALCIPWVADTLAYFSGYFFGKRKLCPQISPKKTVEGAIGGVASTGIVAVLVYGFAKSWDMVSLLVVFFGAMILAVVSIYGDLFASVVKRHFGVKDYGKLFPGHGGIMDRFDSTIPVAITLQMLLNIPYFAELL